MKNGLVGCDGATGDSSSRGLIKVGHGSQMAFLEGSLASLGVKALTKVTEKHFGFKSPHKNTDNKVSSSTSPTAIPLIGLKVGSFGYLGLKPHSRQENITNHPASREAQPCLSIRRSVGDHHDDPSRNRSTPHPGR